MSTGDITQYVKEQEVSRITGLALQTLRNYRTKGIGPTYCKIGRSVRYPLADLRRWLEAHTIKTTDSGW